MPIKVEIIRCVLVDVLSDGRPQARAEPRLQSPLAIGNVKS
jgi:hypothetical protein